MSTARKQTPPGAVVKIEGFVYELDFGCSEPSYVMFSSDTQGCEHYTLMGPASFEFVVPDDFNPTAQKLAALERQKADAARDYAREVAEINERISKLTAIEYVSEFA